MAVAASRAGAVREFDYNGGRTARLGQVRDVNRATRIKMRISATRIWMASDISRASGCLATALDK